MRCLRIVISQGENISSHAHRTGSWPREGGAPLHGLYRYVRPQRVWFFSCFGHKLGIDFSYFAAILVTNRVSIFALQSSILLFLEEAASSSHLTSPIPALPSSTLFNVCYAGQIKPATKAIPLIILESGHKQGIKVLVRS